MNNSTDHETLGAITLSVPMLPPTVNHMYITLKHGGKALSADCEAFRREVWAALSDRGKPHAPDGPLFLYVRLTFGDRRRQDLDNRLKAAIDALALALRFDDSRIVRIVAERAYVQGRPRCDIALASGELDGLERM